MPDTANAEQATANAEQIASDKPLTKEDLLAQLAKIQATNDRLLEESKKYKAKYSEVKEQKDAEEKRLLEEQGKYKELYLKQQQELEATKKAMVYREIKSAVASEATKLGAVDTEDLFKLGNSGLLQYDDSSGAVIGVSEFLDDLRKRKSYLFHSKAAANVSNVIPNGKVTQPTKITRDTLKSLTHEQRKELLAHKMKG
jgi:hypothetical protein